VKLQYDADTEQFRRELVAWLEANGPPDEERLAEPVRSSAHMPGWARAWQRRLFDAGWLVPGWPPELGGRNATPVQQLVYFEEMARLPMQRSTNIQGLTIIAPSILDYGNDAQKERWLLPTMRAEISWCLGMSEPGAGSDLAALTTRAERSGADWLVNGQKVWTSGAADSDYCFCFVRTDPNLPKHRGISVLIIDMRSPGVDVRPLPELTDRTAATSARSTSTAWGCRARTSSARRTAAGRWRQDRSPTSAACSGRRPRPSSRSASPGSAS